MDVFSIHSHKGGVGKSTFIMYLSKYLAQVKREKTCLIDLDFQAQGLRSIYLREHLKYDFYDLMQADEDKKTLIFKDVPVKHEQIDNLYFIANYFKPHLDSDEQNEIRRKMYIKLANEIYTGEITDELKQLLRYLEELEFKNAIIDCHPGLILLSEEVVKQVETNPIFITTANIIAFIGLFQNLTSNMDNWKLNLSDLYIIINRVSENFVLKEALEQFMDSRQITNDEKVVCSDAIELIKQKNISVMSIKENEDIRNSDTIINPRTLLSMDIPYDLKTAVENIRYNNKSEEK